MKKILATLSLGAFALGMMTACGPDNRGSCDAAQEALDKAYEDCGIDTNTDFSCETYDDYPGDCTAYFDGVADSAKCEDDTVTFDYGDTCTA